MIIDNEIASSRLNSQLNILNILRPRNVANESNPEIGVPENELPSEVEENSALEVKEINRGVGKKQRLSLDQQAFIGTLAHFDSSQNIEKAFGVSNRHVINLKNGRTNQVDRGTPVKEELKNRIDESLGQVQDVALQKLLCAMGLISDEKLKATPAVGLSQIAGNMSKVVANSLPKQTDNRTQLIVYAPQVRSIDDFKVVESP